MLSMISLYNHQLIFGLFHEIIIIAIFVQWNYVFLFYMFLMMNCYEKQFNLG